MKLKSLRLPLLKKAASVILVAFLPVNVQIDAADMTDQSTGLNAV